VQVPAAAGHRQPAGPCRQIYRPCSKL
jgi:hypothetical protein